MKNIEHVPKHGCYKDLFCGRFGQRVYFLVFQDKVIDMVIKAIRADLDKLAKAKPVNGLAAKWLPSPNSHCETKL